MSAPDRAAAGERGLLRIVGTWALAAGIVNVTIGGGIFRLPSNPDVAGVLGAAAPLAYVLCALAMGLIVLCFAEAGSRVSLTGGPYAYVEVAFGPFVGFLAGVLLWLTATAAVAAVTTVFADNVALVAPALGTPLGRALLIVATIAVVAGVNIRGVRQGARLNVVTTVAKLLPLVLLVVAGTFAIRPEHVVIREMPAAAELSRASIVLIFAFAGIESALVPTGEVKDVARTVPRAIFIAMIGITLLYVLLHEVAQGVLGPALVGSATPLADSAGIVLGPWGRQLLSLGVVVSTFGYLSGMTMAVPRALFAFARDGFLPSRLAAVHPRHQTPWTAIVAQSALVVALALTSAFEQLLITINAALLLLYLACCLAAWELRRRDVREGGVPFRVPGAGVVPLLACAVILFLLKSVTLREWTAVVVVLLGAAALFLVTARRRRER